MELDKLSFPQFIRYGLTGLNTIVLLFMVPILIMKPDILPILLNTSTIIGIALFSLVIGFLQDALKLYQLRLCAKITWNFTQSLFLMKLILHSTRNLLDKLYSSNSARLYVF